MLCDRFVSATCAYQGAAGYDVQRMLDLAPFAIGNVWPDLTVVLDVDVDIGFARTGRKPHHTGKNRKRAAGQHSMFEDANTDAMESRPLEFHRAVRQNFLELDNTSGRKGRYDYPAPVTTIDTARFPSPHEVHHEVLRRIEQHFSK